MLLLLPAGRVLGKGTCRTGEAGLVKLLSGRCIWLAMLHDNMKCMHVLHINFSNSRLALLAVLCFIVMYVQRQVYNLGLFMQKLPQFLQALVELLLAAGVFSPEQAPQHVLINSYSKGAGIAPHVDGPLYSPCVATITLGGPALMAFHEAKPDGTEGSLATEVLRS